jgi:hypothetical protein
MIRRQSFKTFSLRCGRLLIFIIASFSMFAGFSGCSMKKIVVWQVADLMQGGFPAYMKETDPVLVCDAMPANLKLIDAMLENDPENRELLSLACQGYAAYAFLFVEEENPDRAKNFYMRAQKYGFSLLKQRHLLPDNQFDLNEWNLKIIHATKKDLPAIFWTAFAWGGRIQLDRESPLSIADLPLVICLAEKAEALDPSYWFAGPDTFLGFYYGSLPVMLGGKPDKAKAYFESALSITRRKFLMIQVLYARSYAVLTQDREMFNSLLQEVIRTTDDALPEAALSNAIAREKAGRLLKKSDELFQ